VIGNKLSEEDRRRIEIAVEAEIAEAFAFAESAELPPDSELLSDIFRTR